MLDRMEQAGLISRERDDPDRRKTKILLTELARGLEGEYDRLSDDMTDVYMRGFSPEEVNLFEQFLNRVLKNLEDEEK